MTIIYLVNFIKGFEMAIIVIAVISFLLFNLFLTIRYLRKLPKYYAIEVVDTYGNKTAVEGLRVLLPLTMQQKVMLGSTKISIRINTNSE
jgi:hypothetical protein